MALSLEACQAKVDLLEPAAQQALLAELEGWQIADAKLVKTYRFTDYAATIAFVNAVAAVAQQQDHHPALLVTYDACEVCFDTHSVHGLSRNDFICAARLDALSR